MSLKSLFLFAALACVAVGFPAKGESYTVAKGEEYEGWVFEKNSDGTFNLTSIPSDYAPVGGELYIPANIEVSDGTTIVVSGVVSHDTTGIVGHINDGVFSGNPNITSITISSGIKSIGSSAFAYCTALESVKFESGSKAGIIGDYAFNGCRSLVSIKFPDSVTKIGQSAFAQCEKLASLTMPSSLVEIGACAFQWCKGLKSVKLNEGLKSIGSYAFGQCESLTAVTIPGSVSTIGQYAFQYCYKLTSVIIEDSDSDSNRVIEQGAFNQTDISSIYIPGSISVIQNNAFEHCGKLTTVVIGDGVDEIQSNAFGGCGSLSDVRFDAKSNPPTIAGNAFTDWRISNGDVTVAVPDDADYSINLDGGSLSVEKKPKDPTTPTSIGDVSGRNASPVAYFTLSGQRVSCPNARGVMIAVYADGSSRKFLSK